MDKNASVNHLPLQPRVWKLALFIRRKAEDELSVCGEREVMMVMEVPAPGYLISAVGLEYFRALIIRDVVNLSYCSM